MVGMIDSSQYQALELRAHELLAGVPLHDVWVVDLPGGGADRTITDVQPLLRFDRVSQLNWVVRCLFGLRFVLGRVFGWDDEAKAAVGRASYLSKLSDEDRAGSMVAPGEKDGPFTVLYVGRREAISEARNRTVHAFLVLALVPRGPDYRLYWAVYVAPVGRLTAAYMALIDPFRRRVVYPAILRYVRRRWIELYCDR